MHSKRQIKKFLALTLALLFLLPVAASADTGGSFVSIGADLSQEQRDQMIALLVPEGEPMKIVTVTSQEEHQLLGAYISADKLGTRSISCASVRLLSSGSGITVNTHNIVWVSEAMYRSALITAGITDAQVTVAAPFQVSGTAALAGIYKAYESAAGVELASEAKEVAGEELALTGQLGDILGQEEAAALIARLKEEIIAQGLDKPENIRPAIQNAARELGISLTEDQLEALTQLLAKLVALDIDPDKLAQQVESIARTLENLQKAQQSTQSFFQKVQSGWDSVVNWFKGLFGR